MKFVECFGRLSRSALAFIAVGLILAIGVIDYATGPHFALLVFYLVPVALAARFGGRRWALSFAIAASAIWHVAQQLDPNSSYRGWLLLWNTLMRCGVLLALAALTSEVLERSAQLARTNESLQAEVAERREAQNKLKLLNEHLEARVAERSLELEDRARQLAESEAALRQQRNILQSILNSMGDGVIVADAQQQIVLFNPAAERLFGRSLANVAPEDWLHNQETYLQDNLTGFPTSEHPLARAIRGERVDGAEMFLRHPQSNNGIWLGTTARPLVDDEGKVQGGVVVFSDITYKKNLEKQIAETSEREQRRIGQDLHDNLCQYLVSMAFAAEVLREKLASRQLGEAKQAETISEMINDAITQARQLARGLYPVRLEVDGLASALEELTKNITSRTRIVCSFVCEEPVLIHDEVAGSNLYRIAQEAINNAVKHASAKVISIALGAVEDEVTLTVKDDGVGFPDRISGLGMGLRIMNHRAKLIGASLDIRRGVSGGTIVICSFQNRKVVNSSSHARPSESNL